MAFDAQATVAGTVKVRERKRRTDIEQPSEEKKNMNQHK